MSPPGDARKPAMRSLLLSQEQAGEILGLSYRTVRRLVASGHIASIRINPDGRKPGPIPMRSLLAYAVEVGIIDSSQADRIMSEAIERAASEIAEVVS